MFRHSVAASALIVTVCGCSSNQDSSDSKGETPATTQSSLTAALKTVSSCSELSARIKQRSLEKMNAAMDELVSQVETQEPTGFCYMDEVGLDGSIAVNTPGVSSGATSGASSAPTSVSETNNQVAGVDEADLVKLDGSYLYLSQGSQLRIVNAWPATDASVASVTELGGVAKKLFVVGDRVLVYVAKSRVVSNSDMTISSNASDCTYGYDCDFTGDGTATNLLVFDVKDRTAPRLVRTLELTGSLIAGRRIGSTVHTVVSVAEVGIPGIEYPNIYDYFCDTDNVKAKADILRAIEETRQKNTRLIEGFEYQAQSIATENGKQLSATDCSDYYLESIGDGLAVTSLVSLDLSSDNSAPYFNNILSRGGAVYASSSSLYVSTSHVSSASSFWYSEIAGSEASTVHQFRIGEQPKISAYVGSGIVPGRVLSQFSMDEYQDNLRIATTTGQVPNPDVKSTLSVLKLKDGKLEVVGQVDNIAPSEDIRSVRFDRARGYLVSFKKTDPLFVLDLSEPTAPAVVGELKIQGFSTYMHLLDDTHLLALGYEADDQGSFAYFNGIQLQIFDVTKPTEPSLLQKKVYGTRGSSSAALTDHLGFTFLPDRGLLTLPITICDGGGNGSFGSLSFSGVVALSVSTDKGFSELGRLAEPYPSTNDDYDMSCSNWWTDASSVVSRTVVMDDYLYAISDARVRIQNLANLGKDVRLVEFPPSL